MNPRGHVRLPAVMVSGLLCLAGCTAEEIIGALRDTETAAGSSDTPFDTVDTDDTGSTDTGSRNDTGDTGSANTADTADTDTPADTADTGSVLTRVPFIVSDDAPPGYLWVDASTNPAGFQGQWYPFADPLSTLTIRNEGAGTICGAGQVAAYTGEGYTFAGIGFSLCNNGPDVEPIYEVHDFGSCPLIPDLAARFVGVSFSISGGPLPGVDVEFKDPATINPPWCTLTAPGRGDYAFVDAQLPDWNPTADVADTTAIQFIVRFAAGAPVNFDFCVSDVEILISSE